VADRQNDKARAGNKGPSPEQEAQAVRDKTARLRALRLARDAANPPPPPAAKRAAPKKKAGKSSETGPSLSEWLTTQQNEGRRN
jgi:hypothetical protein